MYKLLLTFLLLACSTFSPKSSPKTIDLEAQYVSMVQDIQDENGFIDTKYCDSILHTALIGVHPDIKVNLEAAEKSPGEWLRRPLSYPECFESGESRSTISRDMLLGVMWWAVVNKDLGMLERMWDYGTSNAWFMGNNVHTVMNFNMITLLAKAIYKLGGSDYLPRRSYIYFGNCEGYVCHLSALQIALNGYIEGSIRGSHVDYLIKIADKNPNNILFAALKAKYVDYDFAKVFAMIAQRYPADRLPNTSDWCDDWPVQREDTDSNLRPCKGVGRQHSGGELLFTLWIIKSY